MLCLIKSITVRTSKNETTFIFGSMDCKNPFFKAYSSLKTDSFKKDRAPTMERSIKLLFLNTVYSPFFVKILPIINTTTTIIAIPITADII